MFCVVWDCASSKLKDKQYKQKTSSKSYKTEIGKFSPILGFEQPVSSARFSRAPKTFWTRKAICSSSVSKNKEVYTPETSCMKGTSVHIKNVLFSWCWKQTFKYRKDVLLISLSFVLSSTRYELTHKVHVGVCLVERCSIIRLTF